MTCTYGHANTGTQRLLFFDLSTTTQRLQPNASWQTMCMWLRGNNRTSPTNKLEVLQNKTGKLNKTCWFQDWFGSFLTCKDLGQVILFYTSDSAHYLSPWVWMWICYIIQIPIAAYRWHTLWQPIPSCSGEDLQASVDPTNPLYYLIYYIFNISNIKTNLGFLIWGKHKYCVSVTSSFFFIECTQMSETAPPQVCSRYYTSVSVCVW